MKILIAGAGALGISYAAKLSRDHNVVVATSDTKKIGSRRKYRLNDEEFFIDVSAYSEAKDEYDVVMICVKSHATPWVIDQLDQIRFKKVLSLQNGVINQKLILRKFGPRAVAATSYFGATLSSKNSVLLGDNLKTVIGPFLDNDDSLFFRDLTNLFFSYSRSVLSEVWQKQLIMSAQHGLGTITGLSFGQMLESTDCLSMSFDLLHEAASACHAKDGLELDVDGMYEKLKQNWQSLPNHQPSMYVDYQKKRPLESFASNGYIAQILQEHLEKDNTTNKFIYMLLKAMEFRYEE